MNVATPPPRLAQRVNDKIWFAQRLREVISADAVPLTYSIFSPSALAARLRSLTDRYAQVAIKVPDSAGSVGNIMVRAEHLSQRSLKGISQHIQNILIGRGWEKRYPLLVGVWEHPVLDSPSVNFWIPRTELGDPVLECVFSQILTGPVGEFSGATPSRLASALLQQLTYEATCLAKYLQFLGYFGRCSFDSIIIGQSPETATIHWIECNGRWGGVSIPITVANKILVDWRGASPIIIQNTNMTLSPIRLSKAMSALKNHLLRPPEHLTCVIFLSPQNLLDGTGLNAMILEDTDDKADAVLTSMKHLLSPKNQTKYC